MEAAAHKRRRKSKIIRAKCGVGLRALAANAAGELDILGHDGQREPVSEFEEGFAARGCLQPALQPTEATATMMHGRGLNHRTDRIEETAGRRRGETVPRVLGDASSHVVGSPASSKGRAPTCWRTWRWSGCSSPMVQDVNAQDVNACGVFWFYAFISEKPEFFLNLGHPRGCPTNKNLENVFFGGGGQGMTGTALSPMNKPRAGWLPSLYHLFGFGKQQEAVSFFGKHNLSIKKHP